MKTRQDDTAKRIVGTCYTVACFACGNDFEAVYAWERLCSECDQQEFAITNGVIGKDRKPGYNYADWYTATEHVQDWPAMVIKIEQEIRRRS